MFASSLPGSEDGREFGTSIICTTTTEVNVWEILCHHSICVCRFGAFERSVRVFLDLTRHREQYARVERQGKLLVCSYFWWSFLMCLKQNICRLMYYARRQKEIGDIPTQIRTVGLG